MAIVKRKQTDGTWKDIGTTPLKTPIEEIIDGIDTSDATATAEDMAYGKTAYVNGEKITGNIKEVKGASTVDATYEPSEWDGKFGLQYLFQENTLFRTPAGTLAIEAPLSKLGDATPADVAAGKTFTSASGLKITGTATTMSGGSSSYPEGAFVPVTSFTDGKQYALVSLIGGVYRYINTTDYNQYTMTATQITIDEDAGSYVTFADEPVLFTAVASGDGFLLQNGTNYLHGSTSNGTALRVGTTQAVWTVDTSANGGFSSGKYNAKEDPNAVWLFSTSGGYDWSIKYETGGGFGYDREGRDNTYSTGFTSFILYEVAENNDNNNDNDNNNEPAKIVVSTAEFTPSGNVTSIDFTGLEGEPTAFTIEPVENLTLSTTRQISSVTYNGTETIGSYVYRASSYGTATYTYSSTEYSSSYADGTLTLTSSGATTGGYFSNGITYRLVYVINAIATGEIDTSDATVTASQMLEGATAYARGEKITGNIPSLSASTITPSTTNKIIEGGQYLSGAQTIQGDSNLIPSNILSGVSIFGVAGNVAIQRYYTGSDEPSSSLGNNGDIYLRA